MSADIVTRLREAGECPTPLRAYLARAVVLQAADEIERLRREVTETQLTACYLFARRSKTKLDEKARWYAKQMKWDCFKEAK